MIKSLVKKFLRKILTPLIWDFSSAELQCLTTSFSQFGEDVICGYLFESTFRGTYVEVGAYHPMNLSNTYSFYRKGWRGIAIDANPQVEKHFKRFRPEDKFIHTAVGSEIGSVEMYLFEDGAFNCTSDQIENVPDRIRINSTRTIVPTMPLSYILENNNIDNIDLLSIDCEGNDLNVLMSNDWTRWRPRVICIEDHDRQWQNSEISTFLDSAGYQLQYRTGFSTIFIINEFADTVFADKLRS